ncbi:microtubule-associated protein RP/EB family member 2-like [Drosophila albomicans]|uniref:Microtubule-associated protein RP/EB family member 2-like n=1 Tax=Drosophila albomicans TaxID=7291 RepID=A0A6P8WVN1_DROAB|nr:microtubule-associated protein RP/EB family member 2-like [Drosophila albomicans]
MNSLNIVEARCPVDVQQLVKGRYQDNYEFAMWFRLFYEANFEQLPPDYNPHNMYTRFDANFHWTVANVASAGADADAKAPISKRATGEGNNAQKVNNDASAKAIQGYKAQSDE